MRGSSEPSLARCGAAGAVFPRSVVPCAARGDGNIIAMTADLDHRWRLLTAEQQDRLRADPDGPVPRELIPRLEQLGLLPLESPTGEEGHRLPPRVARFIADTAR